MTLLQKEGLRIHNTFIDFDISLYKKSFELRKVKSCNDLSYNKRTYSKFNKKIKEISQTYKNMKNIINQNDDDNLIKKIKLLINEKVIGDEIYKHMKINIDKIKLNIENIIICNTINQRKQDIEIKYMIKNIDNQTSVFLMKLKDKYEKYIIDKIEEFKKNNYLEIDITPFSLKNGAL